MSQQIIFTSYVPTALVGINSASKTLAAEVVTGLPIPTGALPGQAFFLSEKWANQLSVSSVNSNPVLTCHAGWYMVVQVDTAATVANLVQGSIGAQLSLAARNDITDMSHALGQWFNPVVMLGSTITAGNYTIVQVAGDCSVLLAASQTVAVGSVLLSNGTGFCTVGSSNLTVTTYPEIVGISEQAFNSPAAALTLSAVAAASAGSAVYTGTITGGTTPNYVGNSFVITGFTGAAAVNNGTYPCTACSTTTLTLSNPNAVAVTAAGTATATNLIRAYVNLPFGGV